MILGITTSNRLELFKRTIASLQENMLDWGMLNDVVLCDDGSSDTDRVEMERILEAAGLQVHRIYMNPVQGHPTMLNLLVKRMSDLGERFYFHCEDDWILQRQGSPLLAAMDVILSNPKIGQVGFGKECREYEHPDNVFDKTLTGTQFVRVQPFHAAERFCPFTLNPCIMRVESLVRVGKFEKEANFEYNYGSRWSQHGWQTAQLTPPFLGHIGNGHSAYSINRTLR